MFFDGIFDERIQDFELIFDKKKFSLICPLPGIHSYFPAFQPITIFCLLSSDFRGSTQVQVKYFNRSTIKPEIKTFQIAENRCQEGKEIHKLCVSKFVDTIKMGKEKCIFYGEDLQIFQKEWIPSLLGVEFGVLVEGKTSIICVGDEIDRQNVKTQTSIQGSRSLTPNA